MKSIFKSKKVWISIIVVLLVVIGIITTMTVSGNSNTKAVLKQLSLGEKYLSELDYEKAVVAYNKVIEIEPRNLQAYLGLAEAYEGLDQTENAIAALETAISIAKEDKSSNGGVPEGSENIYIKLAGLYENSGDTEKAYRTLQEGFELTGSAKIKELLAKYNPKVEASVLSGNYETAQMVTLVSDATTIYYTLDGSKPTKEAKVYSEPLEIGDGDVTLQVVAENEFGELGEISVFNYYVKVEEAGTGEEPVNTLTPEPTAGDNVVIKWKDPVIEEYVRVELGKLTGDITVGDVKEISCIDITENNVKTLEDLKYFTNLTELSLCDNQISDISSLKGLTNLTVLDLSWNQISDISSLKGLTNLTSLIMGGNPISDISSLKGLTNLTELYLYGNQISDISNLKGLTNLTELDLNWNQISDISSLKGLTNLTGLYLNNNQISDISSLKGLTNLTVLYLFYNQISDISILKGLTNLTVLYLDNNQISDISSLKGLTNLTKLSLDNNQISDISSLKGLTNLTFLDLDGNQITDWSPVDHVSAVDGRPD